MSSETHEHIPFYRMVIGTRDDYIQTICPICGEITREVPIINKQQ